MMDNATIQRFEQLTDSGEMVFSRDMMPVSALYLAAGERGMRLRAATETVSGASSQAYHARSPRRSAAVAQRIPVSSLDLRRTIWHRGLAGYDNVVIWEDATCGSRKLIVV
jgi:hypothetical protein